jgi:hypothetical protein
MESEKSGRRFVLERAGVGPAVAQSGAEAETNSVKKTAFVRWIFLSITEFGAFFL